MSVAYEFPFTDYAFTDGAPIFDVPERARAQRPLASVTELYQPSARSVAAPLRLTRRGVVVLSVAVGLLAAALLAIAWASAPASAGGAGAAAVPASVTVEQGDTLWSIAARVAPNTDPRAEVAHLQQLNHLTDVAIMPGQLIQTR
ncbi:LysM peptidoglycan-binding domain-containing protein [Jatrophihabitans sp.]|uniref:LysM peptidoglycan-binding domain-containing protein n=1 Tax=Jatrophihabitans sp. TaxID=1932789 RepID=UPI0030C75AAD|nr:Cell division suppressor protein YneA [Jatrophihabitans sp.]